MKSEIDLVPLKFDWDTFEDSDFDFQTGLVPISKEVDSDTGLFRDLSFDFMCLIWICHSFLDLCHRVGGHVGLALILC